MKNELTAEEANDTAYRLEEIRCEIKELMHDAETLVEGTPEEMRAKAYWIGHILGPWIARRTLAGP